MANELTDAQKRDIMEYQQLQNQLQMIALQKQQLELQASELEKSGEEVSKSAGPVYRFFGTVVVAKEKGALLKELSEEKEMADVRRNALEKQEKQVREKFDEVKKRLEAFLPKGDSAQLN